MFKRLFGRLGNRGTMPDAGEDPGGWSGTTRDEWTMRGVYFQTAGWRLSSGTTVQMSWVGAFGGTMTITRDDVSACTTDELDLDAVRQQHRSAAGARHGGLVSAEFMQTASGSLALEVVTKYRHGPGYQFEGRLLIDEAPLAYTIALAAEERETGVRESIVNALRMQLGEVDLLAMMSGSVDPATGGRRIPGMQLDPYDSAYDEEATYSASDDPRLDEFLQTHPLAVIRSSLRRARATWDCPTASTTHRRRRPLPASSGPKVILSHHFFEALQAMLRRSDRTTIQVF